MSYNENIHRCLEFLFDHLLTGSCAQWKLLFEMVSGNENQPCLCSVQLMKGQQYEKKSVYYVHQELKLGFYNLVNVFGTFLWSTADNHIVSWC